MSHGRLDHVDYSTLDSAKLRFIEAGRRTARFAERYGFMPDERFGASANLFSLDLKPFLAMGAESLMVTLLPEGLGTADDARPDDLTSEELTRFWYNIGIKTVSVMTNDAASSGMQTILIGLYLPSSEPEVVFSEPFMSGFLDGFVEGCRTVGCVYFSGETPQLKNKIVPGMLDIAGALFGVLPPGVQPVDSSKLGPGDTIVLVESSGPHENGFTSLRQLASKLPSGYRTKIPDGREYWEAINAPSKLYTPLVQKLIASGIHPTNVENITGHGWLKMMRSQKPLRYRITDIWELPPLFQFVRDQSGVSTEELLQIFNCGVGLMVCCASRADADSAVGIAQSLGLRACVAGRVEQAERREVIIEPYQVQLSASGFQLAK